MNNNISNKIFNLSFIKTFLMLTVVLCHSISFWSGNWFTIIEVKSIPWINYFSNYLGTFMVPGFVLVSGFLFYYLKYVLGKYNSYSKFILNKALRLIVPYFFVSLVWVIPIGCFFYKYTFLEIIHYFLLGKSPSQLWFLLMLFLVFIIFYPLADFFKNKNTLGILVILGFKAVSLIGGHYLPNYFQIWSAFSYLTIFYIGFKCGGIMRFIKKINPLVYLLFSVAIFIGNCFISNLDGTVWKIMSLGLDYLNMIVSSIMIWTSLDFIADKCQKWKKSKIFKFFSERSMGVYLFHQQIIYFVIYFLSEYLNFYLTMTLCFIISLGISLGIVSIMLLTNPSRILIGEKAKKVIITQ